MFWKTKVFNKVWFNFFFQGGEKKFGLDPLLVFGKMYSECPDFDDSQSMADLYSEDGTYSGPKIGKKLALKKYDQFALNTGCFWGKYQIIKYYPSSCAWNFCYKNNE